jgi:hypothetical protein
MGSNTKTGVSPGQSRAMTGAAVGPGSISGLSGNEAQKVISRAMKLIDRGSPSGESTKDILTPRKVKVAAESLGIDRGGFPKPLMPPSKAIKNIRPDAVDFFLSLQEGLNLPPSMSIPQGPNTPPPGFEKKLPQTTLPSATMPPLEVEVPLPNYDQPGKVTPPPLLPGQLQEILERAPGVGVGLEAIILKQLLEQGLL